MVRIGAEEQLKRSPKGKASQAKTNARPERKAARDHVQCQQQAKPSAAAHMDYCSHMQMPIAMSSSRRRFGRSC